MQPSIYSRSRSWHSLVATYIAQHGVTRLPPGASGFPIEATMPEGYISLDELATLLPRACQLEDGELTLLIATLARCYLSDSMLERHRRSWIIARNNATVFCQWWNKTQPIWSSYIASAVRAYPERKRKNLPTTVRRFLESFDSVHQWDCLLRHITTELSLEKSLIPRRGCWRFASLPLRYRQLLKHYQPR